MSETSARPSRSILPARLRLLLPSVSDLIFIGLLVGLSQGSFTPRLLRDADIGWHIRNGQQMLLTHTVSRADSFSSTMNGQPWYAWEWLYDIGIAAIHNWLGLNGVVFFTALVVAGTFALAFRLAMRKGAILPLTIILLLLAVAASTIHILARPHVLTWLFAVIWFQQLDAGEIAGGKNRKIFLLPLLMVLWVNLHGGFLTGFALLGIYAVAAVLEYFTRADRAATARWLRSLSRVTGLSLLASLMNPFGFKLYQHLYGYLSNHFLMSHIDEFRSPNFHGAAEQCFLVLVLIATVSLVVTRDRPRVSQVLLILFAIGSGLYASRNLPVSSLLLFLVVAPRLGRTVSVLGSKDTLLPSVRKLVLQFELFSSRMAALENTLGAQIWPVAIALLGLIICVRGGTLGSKQLLNAHFDPKRFPVAAASFIADRRISDPIFCPDTWGGYLIYRLYPETKVVVDDRHDLYGEAFLKDYLKLVQAAPGWSDVLVRQQVREVLVPTESPLSGVLRTAPDWSVSYQDSTAVLFTRNGG